MIEENHIKVTKSARYFTSGALTQKTKSIWFVLHGYGQLAKNFINQFEKLDSEELFVIAPEALSRFYLNGGYGEIGANWMTKEDRENEIYDYVNYLDELYSSIIKSNDVRNCKIHALGFSQGVATLSRWAVLGKSNFDRLIFWAGEVDKELDYSKFRDISVLLIFGNRDHYFVGDSYKFQLSIFDKFGVKYNIHIFDGGHEVDTKVLRKILN